MKIKNMISVLILGVHIYGLNAQTSPTKIFDSDTKQETNLGNDVFDSLQISSFFSIAGKRVDIGNIIAIQYEQALVVGDTLAIASHENNVISRLNLDIIHRSLSERELLDSLKGHKFFHTVDDMEKNTDGNYEIPYLFFCNATDTIMYEINFPIQEPYYYHLYEAYFAKSENPFARQVINILNNWGIDKLLKGESEFKYIWIMITEDTTLDNKPVTLPAWNILVEGANGDIKCVYTSVY